MAIVTFVSWLLSGVVGVAKSSLTLMLIFACMLLLAGAFHLHEVNIRCGQRKYMRHRRLRRVTRADRRFAQRWIVGAVLLIGLILLVHSSIAIALTGAALTFFTYLNGVIIGVEVVEAEAEALGPRAGRRCCSQRTPLLPGTERLAWVFGRRRKLGRITRALACSMLVVACTSIAFLGVAIAAILSGATHHGHGSGGGHHHEPGEGGGGPGGGDGKLGSVPTETEIPDYDELCLELPNPRDIGHGLGGLFRREGAIKAGCGKRAEAVFGHPGTYVAEGICSGKVRSLAVVSAGFTPVIVYDDAAVFAKDAASAGELLFVEAAEAGDGEVVVIGTMTGNYVFARPSPSIRPPSEEATGCLEVSILARPFPEIVPSLAYLWLEHVKQFGWAWPGRAGDPEVGEIGFFGNETGIEIATGGCVEDACWLDGPGEHLTYEGISFVDLALLGPYMPAND